MAKQQTEKQQCKARPYNDWSRSFRPCSRSAGHGLGGCFCKQHSKESEAIQRSDLEYWQRLKEQKAKEAVDYVAKLREDIAALTAKLHRTEEAAAVKSHIAKAERAKLDKIYEEARANNAEA